MFSGAWYCHLRMTLSKPVETLLALLCCMNGEPGNGTPFEKTMTPEEINEELKKHGITHWGNHTMISGITGEVMEAKIYMGPMYYQRLKHMVDDKIHARSQNGPRDILSHQPAVGRRRGGGFRIGECEVGALISHGASNFLIDRLINNSDAYIVYFCDDCGNIIHANLKNNTFYCKRCDQNTRISKTKTSYAFKLLAQELMAMGIGVWLQS